MKTNRKMKLVSDSADHRAMAYVEEDTRESDGHVFYNVVVVLDGFRFVMRPQFLTSNKAKCLYFGTLERIYNGEPKRYAKTPKNKVMTENK